MSDSPAYAELAAVPFGVLCGLVHEHGEPAWRDRYGHPAEREQAVLRTTDQALRAAARGERPAAERPAPPPWLAQVARQGLSRMSAGWPMTGGYAELRLWERLGLVTLPLDDVHALAMISALGDRWGRLDRAELLRGDPELRERVWRVLEVEGDREVSLANVDKHSVPDATWRRTFLDLVADGTLDRARVLTSCLDALQRDSGAHRAQWFSALYRDLAPTPDELAAHQARHRALLRSGVSSTVTLAARSLRAVGAADGLDDDESAGLAPGLLARTRGAALDVLATLDGVARRRPDLHPVLVPTVATACEHPHVDVQRAAVALLARIGADPLAHADALAPSVRRELGGAPEPAAPPVPAPVGPPPATLRPVTAADLLDRTAALLEDAGEPLEIELVLAGLAALPDAEVLHPLRRRAERMVRDGPGGWRDRTWLRGHLARVVLGGRADPLPLPVPRARFLARRLEQVADVVGGHRPPGVLLATPDTAGGLLDPGRFGHRLAGLAAPPPVEDLVAALLRLGLDGREAAAAVPGDDVVARVVRHALGAPPPSGVTPRRARRESIGAQALWAAAARARHPREDDPFVLAAGLTAAGQGRAVRARVEVTAEPVRHRDDDGVVRTWSRIRYGVPVEHAAERSDPQQPMLALSGSRHGAVHDDWAGWLLATSPHDLEPALTDLVLPVLDATTSTEALHDATHVLTGLARHPGPLGPLGRAALAAGLTARRRDQRVLAVDAVAGAAVAGRLSAPDLAEAMASLQRTATPGRWASALADLAAAHPGPFVPAVLTALLPALPADLRGGHALVKLLLEETVRAGGRVRDPALRGWLDAVPGRGRGARAARTLAGL